jgi:hypothetical protein
MSQNEIFYFTIGQLVDMLQSLPPDLPVLASGYDSGYENFYQPEIVNLKHEPENRQYDGEFQLADEQDRNIFQAVILQRVMRDD